MRHPQGERGEGHHGSSSSSGMSDKVDVHGVDPALDPRAGCAHPPAGLMDRLCEVEAEPLAVPPAGCARAGS